MEKEEKAVITVRYNGPTFDPADCEDPLVWSILQKAVVNISHAPICEGEFTNRVVMEQNVG